MAWQKSFSPEKQAYVARHEPQPIDTQTSGPQRLYGLSKIAEPTPSRLTRN